MRIVSFPLSVSVLTGVIMCMSAIALPGWETGAKHCTGVYVGKNLTAGGNVIIGQCGDESSSHWIEVIPSRKYGPDAVIEVGAGPDANLPGVRTEVLFGIRGLP